MPEFDYDRFKSLGNKLNHGTWLSEAPALWADPRKLFARGKARDGESRFYALGLYQGKVWQAVFTLRAGRYRIISFHRANRQKRDAYYRGRV